MIVAEFGGKCNADSGRTAGCAAGLFRPAVVIFGLIIVKLLQQRLRRFTDVQGAEIVVAHKALIGDVFEELAQRAVEAVNVQQADRLVVIADLPRVQISNSSSSVPMPPGRAIKPSASAAIRALRVCISGTTSSSVRPRCAVSASTGARG